MKELPITLVLGVVAFGLVLTAGFGHWRMGTGVIGLALCLGAVIRLTVPARQAGLLAVRTKGVDAAVLLGLGFALVVLANTIPTSA